MDSQRQLENLNIARTRRRRVHRGKVVLHCVTPKEMKAALVRFYGETGDSGATDLPSVDEGGDPSATR